MDSELLVDVLRVHPEPSAHLDDAAVHTLLTDRPHEFVQFVQEQLIAIAAGSVQMDLPGKQIFSDPGAGGDFRVMPCVLRSQHGVRKTVKIVGTNEAQQVVPDQITVGRAFALHPVENFVTHSFSACLLSSARTGVCVAVAAQRLYPECTSACIVGAGRVGYYAGLYLASLPTIEKLYLVDLDPERARRTSATLDAVVDATVLPAPEMQAADVMVLATTSREPIYGPHDVPARTIISVGADTDWQRELDPSFAASAAVFVDTMDSVNYGDLKEWLARELVTREALVDLISIVSPSSAGFGVEFRQVFISTGSALFDNLAIGYLLACSKQDTL